MDCNPTWDHRIQCGGYEYIDELGLIISKYVHISRHHNVPYKYKQTLCISFPFGVGTGDWQRGGRLPNIESYSLGLSIEWSNRAKGTSRIKEFILKWGTRTPRQARMNEPVALLKTFALIIRMEGENLILLSRRLYPQGTKGGPRATTLTQDASFKRKAETSSWLSRSRLVK